MGAEDDYIESGGAAFVMELGKCRFIAWMPRLKAGGFDLYFDRANSEFECLEIDQITWLRREAKGDDVLLLAHFPGNELNRQIKRDAEARFGEWLRQNLAIPWSKRTRAEWGTEGEVF